MDEKEGRGNKAAKAAAHIAAALATTGAKGAALAAAQEAAPYLIKIIAGALALLLLIPMLVFTALPNIFFGYDSSTTPEIVDFTTSAHGLEAVYQNIDRKNQSIIDRLVESILPNFMIMRWKSPWAM